MNAIFIDCYAQGDNIALWFKEGKCNRKIIDRFIPEIYIGGGKLKQLKEKLKRYGVDSYFKKKRSFYNNKEVLVLSVPVYNLSRYKELINYLERIEDYAIEIYNADMKIEELYMFQKDIFPTAKVDYSEANGKLTYIKLLDDSSAVDYEIPDFEMGKLNISTTEDLTKNIEAGLLSITYNGQRFSGNERNILIAFKRSFEANDPDIIWTENGNLILPYLKKQFEKYSIDFNFNRFERDDFEYKKGDSYWAYTNIIYRTASVFLKGRLHFDSKSFFADDTGFYGVIDGARVCRQRIQRVEMRSAGAAVTNLLLYESFKRDFLLPYKIGIYERFKTLKNLYDADRGPIIFEPRVGFHNNVVELDFISLYPQIMWKKNLSPETLFCKCCKNNKVPGLQYNFCGKQRGVVSIVAENLIERRIKLKKQGSAEAKEKASYLKWLLVTMFGYQAFKNRKIGIIEAHESIQAYAREIILECVRIAEEAGWEVVHGIVDSIYIKKKNYGEKEVESLLKKINQETGFLMAHEGNYKWIVFLPSILNSQQPVSNHFYGVFENGGIKCRGIEARRKDSPVIVSNMQNEMIELLGKARYKDEFAGLFPKIFKILKKYAGNIDNSEKSELVIARRISREEYRNDIPQKIILKQLSNAGWRIHPGQTIKYIIRDVKNKNPLKRYIAQEDYDGKFDKGKYIELMVKATFNILQPFGFKLKDISQVLDKTKQTKLEEYYAKPIV